MIIGEERCPGVYGKWAHANQCRTDLEGALGCLIYCLSTSLGEKKKNKEREEKREERRNGQGALNTKALVLQAVCSTENRQTCAARRALLPSPSLSLSPALLLSRAQCGWQLGRLGQLSIPHLPGLPKCDQEGRVRLHSWRVAGRNETAALSLLPCCLGCCTWMGKIFLGKIFLGETSCMQCISLAPPEHGAQKTFPLQVKPVSLHPAIPAFPWRTSALQPEGSPWHCPELPIPRQPLLPLQGEDVAHVPVQHSPHHEDRGVVQHYRAPEEREKDNSTETIRVAAVPTGHPGTGFGLCWGMANANITAVGLLSLQGAVTKAHPSQMVPPPPFRNPPNSSDSTTADKSAGGKGPLQPPRGLWSHPQLSGHQGEELCPG